MTAAKLDARRRRIARLAARRFGAPSACSPRRSSPRGRDDLADDDVVVEPNVELDDLPDSLTE